jgi:hypothetical protein
MFYISCNEYGEPDIQPTPTLTSTPRPTYTPTSTPTGTPTSTPTGTPTSTPTGTPTSTPTSTPTPVCAPSSTSPCILSPYEDLDGYFIFQVTQEQYNNIKGTTWADFKYEVSGGIVYGPDINGGTYYNDYKVVAPGCQPNNTKLNRTDICTFTTLWAYSLERKSYSNWYPNGNWNSIWCNAVAYTAIKLFDSNGQYFCAILAGNGRGDWDTKPPGGGDGIYSLKVILPIIGVVNVPVYSHSFPSNRGENGYINTIKEDIIVELYC